jgi:hypothetical protein
LLGVGARRLMKTMMRWVKKSARNNHFFRFFIGFGFGFEKSGENVLALRFQPKSDKGQKVKVPWGGLTQQGRRKKSVFSWGVSRVCFEH